MKKIFIFLVFVCLLSNVAYAEIDLVKSPTLECNDLLKSCTSRFTVKNVGSTMERGLIELQPRRNTFSIGTPFSFAFTQKNCDSRTPWVVHKSYILQPGEEASVELTSTNIPDGSWEVILVHVNGCCADVDCAAKHPFGWREKIGSVTFRTVTEPIECNYPYDCRNTLENKYGVLNCKEVDCRDAGLPESRCYCSDYGECNSGAKQTITCEDGATISVRECNNAQWVETGKQCEEIPIPPEPDAEPIVEDPKPIVDDSSQAKKIIIIGGLLLLAAFIFVAIIFLILWARK